MKVIEAPERETWVCIKCGFRNPVEATNCLRCGTPRIALDPSLDWKQWYYSDLEKEMR